MSISREQYISLLEQVKQNIVIAEKQVTCLKLQEKVSNLFVELNDSEEKTIIVPTSKYLHAIIASPTFFKCEVNEQTTIKVTKTGDKYIIDEEEGCSCYFVENELEDLCKDAEWTENKCEIKVNCCKISPAWLFSTEQIVKSLEPAVLDDEEVEEQEPMTGNC